MCRDSEESQVMSVEVDMKEWKPSRKLLRQVDQEIERIEKQERERKQK
jgi:hypothetical protein